ncbi:MAG: GH32 C-terminal domain-containing protein [Saprospiraceae bacterium]|nr:GH32 C-terminal domain-containing protein [Saprospiraceae bacterium]
MSIKLSIILSFLIPISLFGQSVEVSRTIRINKKYLNFPIDLSLDRSQMTLKQKNQLLHYIDIRISNGNTSYWVYKDMSEYMGKDITINYPKDVKGLHMIYQADTWAGQDSVYQESNRPQLHFSSQRGWNNDPNGLIYVNGEYHLYYQHNPYEHEWGNMHWGHAVSRDLLHWVELGDVLFPDEQGTMFSGTATIDYKNSSGFQKGPHPPIVAAYTAHKSLEGGDAIETQCIAYSNDNGRTFTKYKGNPIINSKKKWNSRHTRDPKIFWHEDSEKWIMVLFEKDGHSFYSSDDLKKWEYNSHLVGFWECPELFELPIDGNAKRRKWVIYGASGTYMIGDFDGKIFIPASGKLSYVNGQLYAAQTFNNIPNSDDRRIQIAWGRGMNHGGQMPFGQMMLFPTELSLKTTKDGIRLFNNPIQEIEKLQISSQSWKSLNREEANEKLSTVDGDLLHVIMEVKILDGTEFELRYKGNTILKYDMNFNRLNGAFYNTSKAESGGIELEMIIDKTSIEIFADDGAFTVVQSLEASSNSEGLWIASGHSQISIENMEIHKLQSIWQQN